MLGNSISKLSTKTVTSSLEDDASDTKRAFLGFKHNGMRLETLSNPPSIDFHQLQSRRGQGRVLSHLLLRSVVTPTCRTTQEPHPCLSR